MNAMKMCLNWKVMAGLAAVGVGIWLYAPSLLGAALPLLILALCPLSMLLMMPLMMRGMQGSDCQQGSGDTGGAAPRHATQGELATLKERLTTLQQEQERLSHEIARQEASTVPAVPERNPVTTAG
ncbi:MAG TPA: DUF2933 domain-containing protein [Chloroflexota bacterium]|nr:DUF2933 domain-containing protein [Chloroflexota bacterium]